MISEKELKNTDKPGIRLRGTDANVVSLSILKDIILQKNEDEFGLPISISMDQIKYGNLFKSSFEDCIIVTNTDHPVDYFRYCIVLRKQGKMATIQYYYYGSSDLTGKMRKTEERKAKGLGGLIMNAVQGVDKSAFQSEYEYYDMLDNLLEEAVTG